LKNGVGAGPDQIVTWTHEDLVAGRDPKLASEAELEEFIQSRSSEHRFTHRSGLRGMTMQKLQ
jgi:hypothetical protein